MKSFRFGLLVCLVFSMITPAFADFKDVSNSHPNADAIFYVQSEGIVSGYPDGTFRPDQPINRAEFIKIAVEVGPEWIGTEKCFSDVESDAWFHLYVCYAKKIKMVSGYPDGSFKPTQNVTFVEAAKMIMGSRSFYQSVEPDWSDLFVWYKPYVVALGENMAIPTSITSLNKQITRGEMAEIMYRLKVNVTDKPSKKYSDFEADVPDPVESPQIVVKNYALHTLAMIPGANYDFEKAKTYLTAEFAAEATDEMFIPMSYGFQDGPDRVTVIQTVIRGEIEATVTMKGYYGEFPPEGPSSSLTWDFELVRTPQNEWKISSYRQK